MGWATLTYAKDGGTIVFFANGIVVRRTDDDTATAVFVDGVVHVVEEPLDKVVAALTSFASLPG